MLKSFSACLFLCGALISETMAHADIPCSENNSCQDPLICDTAANPALCRPPSCNPSLLSADCPPTWVCILHNTEGDTPPTNCGPKPHDPTACQVATQGICTPPFLAPCRENADCGSALFECKIRSTSAFNQCDKVSSECASSDDLSCPEGSTCVGYEVQPDGECGPGPDGVWTCTSPPPEILYQCEPPYWYTAKAFYSDSGSSGPLPSNTDAASTSGAVGNNSDNESGCQASRHTKTSTKGLGWWGMGLLSGIIATLRFAKKRKKFLKEEKI